MAKNKSIKEYLALADISAALVLKNLPFVFFVAFLGLVYIANAHYSEKTIREIQKQQKELKELRWHFMSVQSEIMYSTKLSQVSSDLDNPNLKTKNEVSKKVIVKRNHN